MAIVIKGLIIWESKCQQKFQVVCDGYAKYEEAEGDISAIMQDSLNNGKTQLKIADWGPFSILLV